MLIDINTTFGKSPTKRVVYAETVTAAGMFNEPALAHPTTQEVDWSLDNLLHILEKHEVSWALTYSLRGKLYDFITGNDETWQAAQQHSQLIPVATIDPRRHFGCPEEIQRCIGRGFKIFRFFPDEQKWSLSSLPFLKIAEELADYDVTVILPAGDWGQQTLIGKLICPFGFNVVVIGAAFDILAETIAVAGEYDNFFCETSLMHTGDAIPALVSQVGADKLMFGSNAPESYFAAAYNLVVAAELSGAEREEILGANAARCLGLSE